MTQDLMTALHACFLSTCDQVFLGFVAVVYNNFTDELSAAPKLKCECLQSHLLS